MFNSKTLLVLCYSIGLSITVTLVGICRLPHDPISVNNIVFGIIAGFVSGLVQGLIVLMLFVLLKKQLKPGLCMLVITITSLVCGYLFYRILYSIVSA